MPETPENSATPENSNAIALGLIGDEWNLAIVRLAIMSDVRRYKDFRHRLGIANPVLTARLRRLTEARVFTTAQCSAAPLRVRAHRARPRSVEGTADHLVVGSRLHCSSCALELHGSQIQVGGDPPKSRA